MFSSHQRMAAAELERRRRIREGIIVSSAYDQFKKAYWNNPVGFVHDCFKWKDAEKPAEYQERVLSEILPQRRICLRGPHGLGKSAVMSWAILWFALTRDGEDWKTPITASVYRQLSKFLWPEVRKWAGRLSWATIGRQPFDMRLELQRMQLSLTTGEAFTMASNDPALMEGAHAENLLYVFDESKSVHDEVWDAAEGAFSTGNTLWLASSTPGEMKGRFYEINARKPGFEDWYTVHVTMEDAIKAGRMSPDWVEARKRQWGATSAVFKNRVMGEFAADDITGVIPLAWVEQANDRWREWSDNHFIGHLTHLGVDVGGGMAGSDKSKIAEIYDSVRVKTIRQVSITDPAIATMQLAGEIAGILSRKGNEHVIAIIDVVGIGAGVVHRLREMGFGRRIKAFSAGRGTKLTDTTGEKRFANWRAAGWWTLREMLMPGAGFGVCLPPDDNSLDIALTGDLTSPRYREVSDGVIQIEGKESLRKRLGRSTDDADSVIHGIVGQVLCEEAEAAESEHYEVTYDPPEIGNW